MDWDEEDIDKLRLLWSEGHSTIEIARRMGTSKNSVVGKAHRLNLPARPSPIRRGVNPKPRVRARRAIGPPLAPLDSVKDIPLAADDSAEINPVRRPARRKGVTPSVPTVFGQPAGYDSPDESGKKSKRSRALGTAIRPCCWPIGEPGQSSFRFCDANTLPGRPYCLEHCNLAYVDFQPPEPPAAANSDAPSASQVIA